MLMEQAVYTSVRGPRRDGYQLVATSPGISREQAQELATWGPAHDSFCDARAKTSVNFHRLATGGYAISRSVLGGAEYSGRGGERVYTQMLVVDEQLFSRFAYHPFRVLEALQAAGRLEVLDRISSPLPQLPLPGRGSACQATRLARATRLFGAERLTMLVEAATSQCWIGIVADVCQVELLAAAWEVVPLPLRPRISFTTGLRISPQRPFRFVVLPADPAALRQFARHDNHVVLDLTVDLSVFCQQTDGWTRDAYELLSDGRFTEIARRIESMTDET